MFNQKFVAIAYNSSDLGLFVMAKPSFMNRL